MTTTNLARDAHRQIIRMILEGALKPGEILQEAALGQRLNMSRTPVREAIKRIESEGLAEMNGRFVRVRKITPEEVDEIFFLRLALEPRSARDATAIDPDLLDQMELRIRDLMRNGPGQDDLQWHVDNDFHRLIATAAGNRSVAKVISDLQRRTCIFDHTQVPARFLKGCTEHLEILNALRRRDAAQAETMMRLHLENARDAIFGRLDDIKSTGAYSA